MPKKFKRIGVLLPPNDVTLEYEFRSYLPEEVTFHVNRLVRPDEAITAQSLLGMMDSLDEAARILARTRPDVILYGCTSGSLLGGHGNHRAISKRILDGTATPAITTGTAVLDALTAVGARKIFMVTPYPEAVNRGVIDFLHHCGFETTGLASFLCHHGDEIGVITSDETADMIRDHRGSMDGADTVFISCTNLRAMDQIEPLENELGRAVVTSNQASMWACLRAIGMDSSEVEAGRLFGMTHPEYDLDGPGRRALAAGLRSSR